MAKAMEGYPPCDAQYYQLLARAVEQTGHPEDAVLACLLWNLFRQAAAGEGWFAPNGPEAAAIYLHMADLLQPFPSGSLSELQRLLSNNAGGHMLLPGWLYQEACALDPHSEAFSQWLQWAKREKPWSSEDVARSWRKICPGDIEPVLFLMSRAARRGAFQTALQHLDEAERIDGAHPAVRRARLPLLAARAMQHIQRKKLLLAAECLAEMAALPHSQEGDRPAFLAALRHVMHIVGGDGEDAAVAREEVARLLDRGAAASLLVSAVARLCRRSAHDRLRPIQKWTAEERAGLPAAIARVSALFRDMEAGFVVPWKIMVEAAKHFRNNDQTFEIDGLYALGEAALAASHFELAYAVSAAGFERRPAHAGRFLLLRARSAPVDQLERRVVCAAAAAEIARQHGDSHLVEEALEFARGLDAVGLVLTTQQAADVLSMEKAARKFTSATPSLRGLLGHACGCPECRRQHAGNNSRLRDSRGFGGAEGTEKVWRTWQRFSRRAMSSPLS
jgi:hypothetical protein